jgi:hypothetical protein
MQQFFLTGWAREQMMSTAVLTAMGAETAKTLSGPSAGSSREKISFADSFDERVGDSAIDLAGDISKIALTKQGPAVPVPFRSSHEVIGSVTRENYMAIEESSEPSDLLGLAAEKIVRSDAEPTRIKLQGPTGADDGGLEARLLEVEPQEPAVTAFMNQKIGQLETPVNQDLPVSLFGVPSPFLQPDKPSPEILKDVEDNQKTNDTSISKRDAKVREDGGPILKTHKILAQQPAFESEKYINLPAAPGSLLPVDQPGESLMSSSPMTDALRGVGNKASSIPDPKSPVTRADATKGSVKAVLFQKDDGPIAQTSLVNAGPLSAAIGNTQCESTRATPALEKSRIDGGSGAIDSGSTTSTLAVSSLLGHPLPGDAPISSAGMSIPVAAGIAVRDETTTKLMPTDGAPQTVGTLTSSSEGHNGMPVPLVATPTTLEVGIQNGAHGWLTVRAERGDGGIVNASVSAASSAGQEMLHRELPALTAYLGEEKVSVGSVVVHTASTGNEMSRSAEGMKGDAGGQSPPRGQEGERQQQAQFSEIAGGVGTTTLGELSGATEETLALPVSHAMGGAWLSVRA